MISARVGPALVILGILAVIAVGTGGAASSRPRLLAVNMVPEPAR